MQTYTNEHLNTIEETHNAESPAYEYVTILNQTTNWVEWQKETGTKLSYRFVLTQGWILKAENEGYPWVSVERRDIGNRTFIRKREE